MDMPLLANQQELTNNGSVQISQEQLMMEQMEKESGKSMQAVQLDDDNYIYIYEYIYIYIYIYI